MIAWSEADEARRLEYVATGTEPRLLSYWRSTSTEALRACLDDLTRSGEMRTIAADVRTELAYRGAL